MTPAEGWGPLLVNSLGMDPYQIPVVVAASVAVYLVFMLVVRVFGTRLLFGTTTTDAVVAVMLGSIAGRGILGETPTVAAALVALLTLALLESFVHAAAKAWKARRAIGPGPTLVYADGAPLEEACHHTHTTDDDLRYAMRQAGVANPSEVQCIVLEPRGTFSVIRTGAELDPQLLADVSGAEALR